VIVQDRGRYIAAAGEGLNQTLTLVDTMVRGWATDLHSSRWTRSTREVASPLRPMASAVAAAPYLGGCPRPRRATPERAGV